MELFYYVLCTFLDNTLMGINYSDESLKSTGLIPDALISR